MTTIRISSEQLAAQLMAPINRLLRDVNTLLETEITQEEEYDENATPEMQPMPEQGSATGSIKMSAMPGVETRVSRTGSHHVEVERGLIAKQGIPDQVKLAARPGGSQKNHQEHFERLANPASKITNNNDASLLTQKIDSSGTMHDEINTETSPSLTLAQTETKPKPVTPENVPQGLSSTTLPPQGAVPDSVPATPLPVDSLDKITKQAPFIAKPHRGQPGDPAAITKAGRQANNHARHDLTTPDKPETTALPKRIPLRPRATPGTTRADGGATTILSHVGTEKLMADTTAQQVHSSKAAVAPRSIQRQGGRIIQGVDPVLEHAQQMTNAALSQEAPNEETDLSASRVQNTFNVNVSMNQDAGSASLDRELLKDTLLEMLRTAARRQGLEV